MLYGDIADTIIRNDIISFFLNGCVEVAYCVCLSESERRVLLLGILPSYAHAT